MMKKHGCLTALFLTCVVLISGLSSCRQDVGTSSAPPQPRGIKSIEVATEPLNKTTVYGSEISLDGLEIIARYYDKDDVSISYLGNEDDFTFSIDDTNAGSGRVITLTYKGMIAEITNWTISKAPVTVTAPVGKTMSSNGQPQQLITPGSLSNEDAGEMRYHLQGSETLLTAEEMTATDAGTYSIHYTCIDTSDNYEYIDANNGTPVESAIIAVFTFDSNGNLIKNQADDYYENIVFETITIPSPATETAELGDMLLANIDVRHIVLEEGIKVIGEVAFASCDKLESIVLPSTIKEIQMGAFAYCTSLKEVVLPASLTTVQDYAFAHCSSLTSVIFDGTPTQWDLIAEGRQNIFTGAGTDTVVFLQGDN